MKGHLQITCARNALGANHLREQSFRAPLHLSKPHEDADALVVNLVNPTAGIFDDDEIEVQVKVEASSHLVLTTPSSGRVYRSRQGSHAHVKQTLEIEAGASLEFYPEPFIAHAGARYRQHNRILIAPGASLLYFEWLAPGRVASGEVFQYEELRWETDLFCNDKLAARERYTLSPKDHSLSALQQVFPQGHYLGCFVVGGFEFPTDAIEALQDESVMIGFSKLAAEGWNIKAVCRDSHHARQTMARLREIIYQAMGRVPPALGRF